MVTYPFVWRDTNIESPDNSNDVLVVTKQGYVAIASLLPDVVNGEWAIETCSWCIQTGIGYYEDWDIDKHGEIAYWAEIPMDSCLLERFR